MKLGTCCTLALLTPLAWGTCPEYRTESYRDASGFRETTVGQRPFFKPGVVVTDTLGNIYAADTLTDRIWRIAPAGSVELFAGSGPAGFDGDGKRAPQTQFNRIDGLAVSSAGELFIADRDNHRIRKITTAGLVITVAGTGTSGRGGESQPATATPISAPTALAFDNQNRLLFLESGNERIRRIELDGTLRTVAGSAGSARTTCSVHNGGGAADGQQALATCMWDARGLAVDRRGNIYTTTPTWEPPGSIFPIRPIPSTARESRVLRIAPDGIVRIVAKSAKSDSLEGPLRFNGVAVDSNDTVYASEISRPKYCSDDVRHDARSTPCDTPRHPWYHRVVRIRAGGQAETVAGSTRLWPFGHAGDDTPAAEALFDPYAIAVDRQNRLLIADAGNYRVRRLEPDGRLVTVAGGEQDLGPVDARFVNNLRSFRMDAAGEIYFIHENRVRKIRRDGTVATVVAPGVSKDPAGNPIREWWPRISAMEAAPDGTIYVAADNAGVYRQSPAGVLERVAGGTAGFRGYGWLFDAEAFWTGLDGKDALTPGLGSFSGLRVARDGRLLISAGHPRKLRLLRLETNGTLSWLGGGAENVFTGPLRRRQLDSLAQVVLPAGLQRHFLLNDVLAIVISFLNFHGIVDPGTDKLVVHSAEFLIETEPSAGTFRFLPDRAAFAAAADRWGNLFGIEHNYCRERCEFAALRVWRRDTRGEVCTVAGTGVLKLEPGGGIGKSALGGPALKAAFDTLTDIQPLTDGSLIVWESANLRFVRLVPVSAVSASEIRGVASPKANRVASGQLIRLPGFHLASDTVRASGPPWPTELGGIMVEVTAGGETRNMPLISVGYEEIVGLLPEGLPTGPARIAVRTPLSPSAIGVPLEIDAVAPVLFTADNSGEGAGQATVAGAVLASGAAEQVGWRCGGRPNRCSTVAVDLGAEPERAVLVLRAAGLGGVTDSGRIAVRTGGLEGRVVAVTRRDDSPGVDFLEIALDPVIAGASDVEVSIAVDGVASNTVLVNFGERPRERVRERLGGVAVEANGDLLFSSSSVLYRLLENRLVGVAAGTPGFPGTEGDEGLALLARLLEPTGIAVSPNGEIAIADAEANRVRIVRGDFTIATIPFVLSNPGGVAFGPDGTLYVADTGNNRILRRTAAGDMTTLVREGLSQPGSVAVAGDGSLLVADTGNRRIVRIVDGAIVPVPETDGTEWQRPVAVAAGDAGTLYVADAGARQVVKIDAEGVRAAAGEYEWSEPVAVAIGKDGALYVADRGAGRIVAVTAGGTAVTLVGPPE